MTHGTNAFSFSRDVVTEFIGPEQAKICPPQRSFTEQKVRWNKINSTKKKPATSVLLHVKHAETEKN